MKYLMQIPYALIVPQIINKIIYILKILIAITTLVYILSKLIYAINHFTLKRKYYTI